MATKFNNTLKAKERRARAITRLEAQLKRKDKLVFTRDTKSSSVMAQTVDLSKEDITRINKELSVLKTRI